MDDEGLKNWVYYEPSKGHLNLQLMSSIEDRDSKAYLPNREPTVMMSANGSFHQHQHQHQYHRGGPVVSETPLHMDYMRDGWMPQRDKYLFPGNSSFPMLPDMPGANSLHMLQHPDFPKDARVVKMEEPGLEKEVGQVKKRQGSNSQKMAKVKKARKAPSVPKEDENGPALCVKPPKKNMGFVINGIDMDISDIPIPVCSCTGVSQQCYRWGCGGWQSACCTTGMSMYPLPMSTKRRGARIAGRKMSQGAFKKVVEKLAADGYNFSNPIDLRTHWAKHGTNKFVTIR